jgi:hypothetical protein
MSDCANWMEERATQYDTEDDSWDYRLCRCENNGDHCDYCQSFDWTSHMEPPYTRCARIKPDAD